MEQISAVAERHLRKAIYIGSYEQVMEVLENNPTLDINGLGDYEQIINGRPNYGNTALHSAVCRNEKIVELLLAHPNIDVNKPDINGHTPLQRAVSAHTNHPDIDVNASEQEKSTAFHIATLTKHKEILRLLLNHPNIDVNKCNLSGATPFWCAANRGHTEITKMLLASNKWIDTRCKFLPEHKGNEFYGLTPSVVAIRNGLIEDYEKNPQKTRRSLRIELGWNVQDASELFCLIVLVREGFLKPMELQMEEKRFFSTAVSSILLFNYIS
jgi:hypothetical protein